MCLVCGAEVRRRAVIIGTLWFLLLGYTFLFEVQQQRGWMAAATAVNEAAKFQWKQGFNFIQELGNNFVEEPHHTCLLPREDFQENTGRKVASTDKHETKDEKPWKQRTDELWPRCQQFCAETDGTGQSQHVVKWAKIEKKIDGTWFCQPPIWKLLTSLAHS